MAKLTSFQIYYIFFSIPILPQKYSNFKFSRGNQITHLGSGLDLGLCLALNDSDEQTNGEGALGGIWRMHRVTVLVRQTHLAKGQNKNNTGPDRVYVPDQHGHPVPSLAEGNAKARTAHTQVM